MVEGSNPNRKRRLAPLLGAAMVAVLAILARGVRPREDEDQGAAQTTSTSSASGTTPSPRCTERAQSGFLIGEAPPERGTDESAPDLPFAVEVGRGTSFDRGFAVGTLREAEGGSVAAIATMAKDGSGGVLVKLARSRGDLDPPVVAALGERLYAVFAEPHAGGRALKMSLIEGDQVKWGPEFQEGRDDSLAIDLAAQKDRIVLVWDDVPRNSAHSRILMASTSPTLEVTSFTHPASDDGIDAGSPRIITRTNGFWLAYLAWSDPGTPEGENADAERSGERVTERWIEVVPLDGAGARVGAARPVTPKDGHVLGFDLLAIGDDSLLVAWRDDDTPSGTSGGKTYLGRVNADGGVEPPRELTSTDDPGQGLPALFPGLLALPRLTGEALVAPLDKSGQLVSELRAEPSLMRAEPLASASDGTVLLGELLGKAARLRVIQCSQAGLH